MSPAAGAQGAAATQKASGAEEKHVLMTNEGILRISSRTYITMVLKKKSHILIQQMRLI